MSNNTSSRRRVWLGLALLAATLSAGLVSYLHWDDRAYFWFKQRGLSPEQRAAAVWLPGYRAVIQGRPLLGLEEDETSGLAYSPLSGTLFTVTGKWPQLVEISTDGEVLRVIELVGFADPEAVEVLGDGRIAIVDERARTLSAFHLPPRVTRIEAARLEQVDLGYADAGNKGFEGLAWDTRNNRLLLAKERSPMGLYSLPFPGEDGATGSLQPLPSGHLFLRDLSSLTVDGRTGHTLVLSDESRLLLELDERGQPVSFISLLGGFNGLDASIRQPEGVAMDESGDIYMVGEPNLFYRFSRDPGAR